VARSWRSDSAALLKINPGPDGAPWLDDARLAEVVSSLTRSEVGKLIELNERMTERLLEACRCRDCPTGIKAGRKGYSSSISITGRDRNDFLAINQFRVDELSGQAKKFVAPDVVLFVNGIPLVVIECKSPHITDPMAEGINQLRRYANQRALGMPRATSSCSGPTSSSSRPTATRPSCNLYGRSRALPRVEGCGAALPG